MCIIKILGKTHLLTYQMTKRPLDHYEVIYEKEKNTPTLFYYLV